MARRDRRVDNARAGRGQHGRRKRQGYTGPGEGVEGALRATSKAMYGGAQASFGCGCLLAMIGILLFFVMLIYGAR